MVVGSGCGDAPQYVGRVWHQADHPAIWVVPALGFVAILGNSMFMRFGCAMSEVHHLFSDITLPGDAMTSYVMSQLHMCTSHVIGCYKRLALLARGTLSSIAPCPQGDLGISTRPGSAAPLPVSTASTGLLRLLVGAHVHCGRSDTEVKCVATTVRTSHLVRDTYILADESLAGTLDVSFKSTPCTVVSSQEKHSLTDLDPSAVLMSAEVPGPSDRGEDVDLGSCCVFN